jgi:hypothetical protein
MIKVLVKPGNEETYLNIIKAIGNKITANTLLNGKKLKQFSLKTETRHFFLLLLNIVFQFLARAVRQEKDFNKRQTKRRGRNQITPIFRYMI